MKSVYIILFTVGLLLHLNATSGATLKYANRSWKIVGGTVAAQGSAPHQIVLKFKPNYFTCSGNIISKRTVLTAAHCVKGYDPSTLLVAVGTNQLNSSGIEHDVSRVIIHEEYNQLFKFNDVALMILDKDIIFSSIVKPIVLRDKHVGAGVTVKLTGWGRTSYPGDVSEDLQEISLLTISNKECKDRFGFLVFIFDSEICTLTREGEGACHGDSGGPLTYGDELVGVVSWGRPCAKGLPDVFSRVSSFKDWIKKHME